MSLTKQAIDISFAQGLDLKSDPFRVPAGKFLALENTIFETGGLLQKRNGFAELTPLDVTEITTLGTFNGGLLALGDTIQSYTPETMQWTDRGTLQNVSLSVLPAVRANVGQVTADVAITPTGLACVVWQDTTGAALYQIMDHNTGNLIVNPTTMAAVGRAPRVFILGPYFIVTFMATIAGPDDVLRYIAIPTANPTNPNAVLTISTLVSSVTAAYDGVVANNNLYLAYNGSDGGGAVRVTRMDSLLNVFSPEIIAGYAGTYISITADTSQTTPEIYVTAWASGTTNAITAVYSYLLTQITAPVASITGVVVAAITSVATAGVATLIYETNQNYTYASVRSDYTSKKTVTRLGALSSASVVLRSFGLASKAYFMPTNGAIAFLGAYGGLYQPTYFLVDTTGAILGKLAYSNGAGYPGTQVLSNVTIADDTVKLAYLFTDLIQPVNKTQGVANTAGVFAQKGINIASFSFDASPTVTAEIGGSLNLTGGYLWQYDGLKPVEQGFHVWPEDLFCSTATGAGSLIAQQYYYVATYEWTDGAGNIHRSAPSVPLGQVTTTASSTNTVKVPTLRLTAKTGSNTVRIVLYRWSTAQQTYYQITSITSPVINDTTVDNITYVDTAADSAILGNTILYTTGGVIENIAAPACSAVALFKSRLLLISAEDPNTAWYSKQVIQGTPVEMNDGFTLYLAPTTSVQGSTGPTKVLSAMDDKAIFFKDNAMYYVVGTGPDNTGANNDFSEPVFISATVGCDNQQSVVFMPQGLMFQATGGKGIWILGRDLSTNYIGAPVESYNDNRVLAAVNVPGTNQVRFTLDNGITLMYDYYYGQWGTFKNVSNQSSVIYAGLHTFLNSTGHVFQETPGLYLDGTRPTLMSFTTGWINLAGLQGYQRAYFFYILATYLSPHKLDVQIATDYNSSPTQRFTITPDNANLPYGYGADEVLYGSGSPYGGPPSSEQWRVFLTQQKCQSIQITINELFDYASTDNAGAGLTISGLNVIIGVKKGYTPVRSSRSAG